jgi:hypothetical protein
MARQLLTLDEVLAMLAVVGVPARSVDAFKTQATAALKHKHRAGVEGIGAAGIDSVTVASGRGMKSERGFVELTINDTLTQMDAAKARDVAIMLFQASEAAISDEIFVKFLATAGITTTEAIGGALMALRELRQGTRGIVWPT